MHGLLSPYKENWKHNNGDKKIFLGQDEDLQNVYYMKGTYYLLRVWDRELAKDHIDHLFNVKDIVDHF